MNRLKSIFITGFLTAEASFATVGAIRFFNDPGQLTAGLSMVLALSILLLFAKFFLFKTPRTSVSFPAFSIFLSSLYLIFLVIVLRQGIVVPDLLTYNTIGIVGWIVYLKWYSVFPDRDQSILQAGNQLPVLEFLNIEGEPITTSDFTGSKTIYLFYRGNWCPLCMAQIKEIAGQYQELSAQGVKIVLISPQPQRHTRNLAKKFDVPFIFLTDEDNAVARQLNIFQQAGTPLGMEVFGYASDTVMPTVIICDENGKIILADLTDNYRVRPDPSTFLEVLGN